jgi:hypothetical protein
MKYIVILATFSDCLFEERNLQLSIDPASHVLLMKFPKLYEFKALAVTRVNA